MPIPEVRKALVRLAIGDLLIALGEDPEREGLKDTPRRVAEMYSRVLDGNYIEPPEGTFFTETFDSIIMVHHVPFYAYCEHHLALFQGHFAVGYLPDGKVIGLSKIIRQFRYFTRKITLQERLTTQVVDFMMETLKAKGAMVHIKAEHTCMTLRGVRAPGSLTTTMAARGCFLKDEGLRNQFITIALEK